METCVQCIHLHIHTHYRKLSAPVFSLHLPLCIPGGQYIEGQRRNIHMFNKKEKGKRHTVLNTVGQTKR